MNSLISLAYRNSIKLASFKYAVPTYQFKSNSNKSGDSEYPAMNELDEIKIIQENEKKYFANVKKSFDSLQNSRKDESLEEKRLKFFFKLFLI